VVFTLSGFGACGALVLCPDNPRADVRARRNMFF
jgi:hypothetical protein